MKQNLSNETNEGSKMDTSVLPESWFGMIFLVWVVPYLGYYLGIIIRIIALARPDSPALLKQLLMGIPVCLVVVSPMIVTLHQSLNNFAIYLFTIGVIIEHGMVMHETLTRHLDKLVLGKAAYKEIALNCI